MRVVQLLTCITPTNLPFFKELSKEIGDLHIFISTPREKNRSWPIQWDDLKIKVQKTIIIPISLKYQHGVIEKTYMYIPYDTLFILVKLKPEWIITNEFGARTFFSVIYKIFHSKTKIAVSVGLSEYSEMNRSKFRKYFRKWLIKKTDILFVNGESGKKYLQKLTPPEKPIVVINYTVDLTPYSSIPLKRSSQISKRFLYSGRLIPLKGLIDFLSVLCRWAEVHSETEWEWWLIGDGPLANQIQEYPLPKNLHVKLFGRVEYSELPKYYAQVGVFVFPTYKDEWGLVINEALASGLPVIGSIYSQAVEELVAEGENGWLFKTDNSTEIFEALERFYKTSKQGLNFMREASRKRVQQISPNFAAQKMAKSISEIK